MKKPMSRRKRTLIAILIVIAAILFVVLIITISSRIERAHDAAPEGAGLALSRTSAEEADERLSSADIYEDNNSAETASLFYNGQAYAYNENLSTLLILGIDDPELTETESVRNTSQADLLLLAVFDPDTKTCTLLQLNRDTMCDVPMLDEKGNYVSLRHEQLALAHTYGNGLEKSCENTVYAVSRFLYGIGIDNYFALTMDAIPVLNDLVGGVTVTVEDDFTGIDPTLIQGETVTLSADNVENYVRSRMNMVEDPTNINRMKRQRTYMIGLVDALKDAVDQDSSFVIDAYTAISKSLVTDCSIDELSDYADRFSGYSLSGVLTTDGEAIKGEKYMEYYVDEEALQELVIDVFYTPLE